MAGDMSSRRVTEWLSGDATGNSVEGLAYYLATQYEGGIPRYSAEAIREHLFRSEHLALSINDPEHVERVRRATTAAMIARIQASGINEEGGVIPVMPNLRSYLRLPIRTAFAYTVTGEVDSTSARNPGTLYRTMVIWSDERLSWQRLEQLARDQGSAIASRTRYWGRSADWTAARITLNVWARRE